MTYGRPSDKAEFIEILSRGQFDVIYSLTHGGFNTSGDSVLELVQPTSARQGEYITVSEIGRSIAQSGHRPLLVFLDGCDTMNGIRSVVADTVIHSTSAIGLVPADAAATFFHRLFSTHSGHVRGAYNEKYLGAPYNMFGDVELPYSD